MRSGYRGGCDAVATPQLCSRGPPFAVREGSMDFSPVESVGYVGAVFALATFAMKTIIPLRVFGIASNVTFLVYGYAHTIYPTLVVNAILLPLNGWRLYEMNTQTRQVR